MRIEPTDADLEAWSRQVPISGDLLFFDETSKLPKGIASSILLSAEEVRAQKLALWKLSDRSWYGYALNRSKCAMHLPIGTIESLDSETTRNLGRAQARLGVPSLIKSSLLPAPLRASLIKVGRFNWITSFAFRKLNRVSRLAVMKAWMSQNEIHFYSSIPIKQLPDGPAALLKAIGFEKVVNSYAKISGPNCMAAVASAVAGNPKTANQWLHWAPLKTFLKERGYKITSSKSPMPEDVLVFMRGSKAMHVAFFLGENLYFEKPGQDFYEPYRIERFDRWKLEWPKTTLSIWRRIRS